MICVCVRAQCPYLSSACLNLHHTHSHDIYFSKKDSRKPVTSSMSEYACVYIEKCLYTHEIIYLGGGGGGGGGGDPGPNEYSESNHGGRIFRIQRAAGKYHFGGVLLVCVGVGVSGVGVVFFFPSCFFLHNDSIVKFPRPKKIETPVVTFVDTQSSSS